MEIKSMGKKLLTTVVALPAILFIVMGLRWLLNPAGITPELGLTLETGLGLSSQIGDLSAFFLVAGLCIMFALVTSKRVWYYPPAMLLLIAAAGRMVAWVIHGAAFAPQMIMFEVVIGLLLLAASRILAEKD